MREEEIQLSFLKKISDLGQRLIRKWKTARATLFFFPIDFLFPSLIVLFVGCVCLLFGQASLFYPKWTPVSTLLPKPHQFSNTETWWSRQITTVGVNQSLLAPWGDWSAVWKSDCCRCSVVSCPDSCLLNFSTRMDVSCEPEAPSPPWGHFSLCFIPATGNKWI